MEIGDQLALQSRLGVGLKDGGDEDGEGNGKDSDGLSLHGLDFVVSNLPIPKMGNDGGKAKQVLCVNGCADADTRDVWVGRNTGSHGGQGGCRTVQRQRVG